MNRDGGGRSFGRDGFGAGRQGRGTGRTPARESVWRRTSENPWRPSGSHQTPAPQVADTGTGDEKWDRAVHEQEEAKGTWQKKEGGNPGKDVVKSESNNAGETKSSSHTSGGLSSGKADLVRCENCGLTNHMTKDCRRDMNGHGCEICGLNNHSTYQCRKCIPWNVGPELCATQVENQSFFFIEENIDSTTSREKECTAFITIVEGEASSWHVEQEFKNIWGSDKWKWKAKPVGEKKFMMRFPDPGMIKQWSYFDFLVMKSTCANMRVEAWSPSVGSKGMLQVAWFRVSGIPIDQRSIKTCAKVGGLVGKVIEIDESSRFNPDYIRLRIACRDVTKVPKSVESTLGMFLHDFFFEREITEEERGRTLKSGVKVGEENPPPSKKYKGDQSGLKFGESAMKEKNSGKFDRAGAGASHSQSEQHDDGSNIDISVEKISQIQEEKELQKEIDTLDKVYIPNTFDSYDTDSGASSGKLKEIEMKKFDIGLEEKQDTQKMSKISPTLQMGYVRDTGNIKQIEEVGNQSTQEETATDTVQLPSSDGILTDDYNSNTQESVNQINAVDIPAEASDRAAVLNLDAQNRSILGSKENWKDGKEVRPAERRRSERCKKDIALTTQEKVEIMSKKRNLEVLYPEIDKETMEEGVNTMLKIAKGFLKSSKDANAGRPQAQN